MILQEISSIPVGLKKYLSYPGMYEMFCVDFVFEKHINFVILLLCLSGWTILHKN